MGLAINDKRLPNDSRLTNYEFKNQKSEYGASN